MTRPRTLTPWANQELYDAPGKIWDATPTKIAPNAGLAAQGWQPGMAPPAQVENHERASERAMLNYLSAIEIQNWCVETVTPPIAVNALPRNHIARSDDALWLAAYRYGTAIVPPNNVLLRSYNGRGFESPFVVNPSWFDFHTIQGVAASQAGDVALALGPVRDDGPGLTGPFKLSTMPEGALVPSDPETVFGQAYGRPGAIVWWHAAGRFVSAAFLGDNADLSDLAFGVASVAPGEAPEILDGISGMFASVDASTATARIIPAGDRLAVMFRAGLTERLGLWLLYRYEAGTVVRDGMKIFEGFDGPTNSIVFDDTRGLFVSAGSDIRTSVDGQEWESSPSSLGISALGIKGDMLVGLHRPLPATGKPRKLAWSLDHGQTWQTDDMPIHVSNSVNAPEVRLTNLGNQFAMAALQNGNIEIAYSLRLK